MGEFGASSTTAEEDLLLLGADVGRFGDLISDSLMLRGIASGKSSLGSDSALPDDADDGRFRESSGEPVRTLSAGISA